MPKLARRLIVAPLILVVDAAIVVLSPLLGIVAALARRSSAARALRALGIAVGFAVRHLGGTLACAWLWVRAGFGRDVRSPRMRHAHYRVLSWFVAGVVRTMTRMARVEVRVTDSEVAERALTNGARRSWCSAATPARATRCSSCMRCCAGTGAGRGSSCTRRCASIR